MHLYFCIIFLFIHSSPQNSYWEYEDGKPIFQNSALSYNITYVTALA